MNVLQHQVQRMSELLMMFVMNRSCSYNYPFDTAKVTITFLGCPHSSLSVCFIGYFPDGSGLADTRTSPFWILLELRVVEAVVTTGAIRHAKLWLNCHHQQTSTHFLQAGCPSCRATNSVRPPKERLSYLSVL